MGLITCRPPSTPAPEPDPGLPPLTRWLVLAFAAVRALVKFNRQDFRWEKTSHSGAHLDYVQPIAQAVSA